MRWRIRKIIGLARPWVLECPGSGLCFGFDTWDQAVQELVDRRRI